LCQSISFLVFSAELVLAAHGRGAQIVNISGGEQPSFDGVELHIP
jgi:hypothetical protein